ncbi:ubiquitin domain-containing protein ubfd1 [Anaeramoeba flamelloides]|uniref:Ubiquitin domain-containing protein ubfd1 n=1 Tax=Anaeramoeba flamelloides TaxID=1746091 RepID=A0AAV7ZMP4_9EUKA|nr:ubiquitin domain-containing protein ubfd1 [Anaeramoeba flamelloides]
MIILILKYKKQSHELKMQHDDTIGDLKALVEKITKVPKSLQKLIYKGIQKNDQKTLREAKMRNKSKVLLIGNPSQEIASTNSQPVDRDVEDYSSWKVNKEKNSYFCSLDEHQNFMNNRKPTREIPHSRNGRHLQLPKSPIRNVWDEFGQRVKLKFKSNKDQLRIKSLSQTLAVQLGMIKDLYTKELSNFNGYSLMGLQTGNTSKSILWFYYVPSHYVRAIRNAILGDWMI